MVAVGEMTHARHGSCRHWPQIRPQPGIPQIRLDVVVVVATQKSRDSFPKMQRTLANESIFPLADGGPVDTKKAPQRTVAQAKCQALSSKLGAGLGIKLALKGGQ